MKIIRDEKGLTMIELLGVLVIFGFVAVLMSSILFSISKASTIQGQQVEFQQTANMMVLQIDKINNTPEIYEDANYFGKFTNDKWKETHIVKLVQATSKDYITNGHYDAGVNPLYITDINDTDNAKVESYQIKEKKVKIKVLQQKNENDERKTIYETGNYRDTFTIQTSGMILFYKDDINFANYYNTTAGQWDMDKLLKDEKSKVCYTRKFVSEYRDNEKAKGDAPGNGRW